MAIQVKVNIDKVITQSFEKLQKEIDIRVVRAFQMACKEAVTYAKTNHGYMQQTGALNSSTGFQLYKEGKLIEDYFEASTGGDGTGIDRGINQGKFIASQRATELGAYICAVIVAGMPYAIYVESKGKDVLTSAEKQFPSILDKWMREAFNDTGISFSMNNE
ncbi:MAG: hypothetical protein LBC68_08070 [Prevotellaceae bacterium]|jgi:hypothetical protein|nr:hypothetical protein [Prevotellaceae bacterium]